MIFSTFLNLFIIITIIGYGYLFKLILIPKIPDKNFYNEDGKFERLEYEKFLLENNISAPLFEKRLKEVFVEYIKQFQEESKTATREWMSGITFDEAKNTILEEHKKFNENL